MTRSPLYKSAVILFALSSLFGIVTAIPALMGGPAAASSAAQGIPQVVILLGTLLSVAGLVAAYGAWQGQKWGIWLVLIISALNGLLALPGVLFAPSAAARVMAIATVILALFVIVVFVRRPKSSVSVQ